MSPTTGARNEWPHFLADLKEKRDALTEVITILETKFAIPDGAAPDSGDPPVARGKKRMANIKTPRRAKVKPAKDRRARQAAGETVGNGNDADRILAALGGRSPMKPRELALATSLTLYTLRQHLKPLVKAGRVEVTGATFSRQVRLAGMKPAKEVP